MGSSLKIPGLSQLHPHEGGQGLQLYLANVDQLPADWSEPEIAVVSEEERIRAASFRDPALGERFLASRRLLRALLSHHTGWSMADLHFRIHPLGKPFIEGLPLHFNLSRSGNLVAIGLSTTGDIGVDIEANASFDTCREVAARVLTDRESRNCEAEATGQFIDAFLAHWALKEAILKTTGEGLSRDMREIEVEIRDQATSVKTLPKAYGKPDDWEAGLVHTGIPACSMAYARNKA